MLHSRGFVLILTAIAVAGALAPPGAGGAPGDLDESFSKDGRVKRLQMGTVAAVAVGPTGEIVVAGSSGPPVVARYTAAGRPDTEFGAGGAAEFEPGAVGLPVDVAVAADGSIYVLGKTDGGTSLARVTRRGQLDPAFAGDGSLALDFEGPGQPLALAVDAAGRAIVEAQAIDPRSPEPHTAVGLARVLPDGAPDSSFSGDGRMLYASREVGDDGGGVAIDRDGSVFAAFGGDSFYPSGNLHVLKVSATGDPFTGFGGGGVATAAFDALDIPRTLGLTPEGRVLIGGTPCHPVGLGSITCESDVIAAFTPGGRPDSLFSGDGRLALPPDVHVPALVAESNGNIALGFGRGDDFAVGELLPGGSFNRNFSRDGVARVDFGATGFVGDRLDDLAIAPDGRLVAAGASEVGAPAIARLKVAAGPHDADADGLRDRHDRCPRRYAKRPGGCRALAVEVRLKRGGRKRLAGRVVSDFPSCYELRDVAILARRNGQVERVATAASGGRGRFTVTVTRDGEYFARVGLRLADARIGECGRARSPSVDVG